MNNATAALSLGSLSENLVHTCIVYTCAKNFQKSDTIVKYPGCDTGSTAHMCQALYILMIQIVCYMV